MTNKRYRTDAHVSRSSIPAPEVDAEDFSEDTDDFDAESAFEELRYEIIRLEALASVIQESVETLPFTPPDRRQGVNRLFAVIEATTIVAREARQVADGHQTKFDSAMAARRHDTRGRR